MFDVGWSEMLVIAVVLIVVVGPKDLPRMLRQFGRTTAKLRAMAGDFRRQFDEALKEAELDDVSETLSSVRKINPMNEIRKHLAPIEDVGQQVRAGLDDALKPQSKPIAAETPAEPVATEPLKNGATALPAEMASPTEKPAARSRSTRAVPAKASAGKSAASGAPKGAAKSTAIRSAAAKPATKAAAAKAPSPRAAAGKDKARTAATRTSAAKKTTGSTR
jgi:sec-independent protein translocase protein TatB